MVDTGDAVGGDGAEPKVGAKKRKTEWPKVNDLTNDDIVEVLALGVADFRKAPIYGLLFGAFFALGGICLVLLLRNFNMPYLVYPLAMGFALVAPFVATGIYEVSRRLERDEPLSWNAVLGSVFGAGGRDLGWMALVTAFTLIIWLDIAALMFFGFFGLGETDPGALIHEVLTTTPGLIFLLVGNIVGAIIAMAVFSYTVVSFPMLLDRDIDFVTAMVTSVKTVLRNPGPMLLWAFIIACALAVSLLTGFLGLILTLPILGHASWHLYRRLRRMRRWVEVV